MIGNVFDRVVYGHVIDWLDFHFGFFSGIFHGGYFPSFNIANIGISVGAFCLILDEILRVRRER